MSTRDRLPVLTTFLMLALLAASAVLHYAFRIRLFVPLAILAALANTVFVIWRRRSVSTAAVPQRPPVLSRTGVIILVAPLLPLSYVLGAPFAVVAAQRYAPAAMPVVGVVYGPLRYYARHPELPGSELFKSYASGVELALR